jgi:acetoin:2,6-dichlorophenolindophenol oxidoreductase subunit alpha
VCENNLYNEYTHYTETTAGEIKARPEAFGVPAEVVDGQDVRAVYSTAWRLVEKARAGLGPSFLECRTYRFHGHHVGDIDRAYYRSKQEEQEWESHRDPVKRMAEWLTEQGLADSASLNGIQAAVKQEISAGLEFAMAAPFPDASEVKLHVYA